MAKARRQKLKVFRTPIGFHDALVAAPSRKAALAAWGAGTDLFSAGIAEEVKGDADGVKSALASPGEVVRVARGGGKAETPSPRSASRSRQRSAADRPPDGRNGPLPRGERGSKKPSRAGVEKAESALAALAARQAVELAELAKEEEKLAKRRRALEDRHAKAVETAEAKRDAASERYRKALAG